MNKLIVALWVVAAFAVYCIMRLFRVRELLD